MNLITDQILIIATIIFILLLIINLSSKVLQAIQSNPDLSDTEKNIWIFIVFALPGVGLLAYFYINKKD